MLETTSFPAGGESKLVYRGVPYYLPRAYLPITITGATKSASDKSQPATTPATGTGSTTASAPTISNTNTVTVNTAKSSTDDPTGTGGSGGANGKGAYSLTVKIGTLQYVGDPSQQYFLQYSQNQYADDQVSIRVDQNGLLATTGGQATDQSAAAASQVVQLLGEIAEAVHGGVPAPANPAGTPPASPGKPSKPPPPCPLHGYTGDLLIDPADSDTDLAAISADASKSIDPKNNYFTIAITSELLQRDDWVTGTRARDTSPPALMPPSEVEADSSQSDSGQYGVVFRSPVQYRIGIRITPKSDPDPSTVISCGILPAYQGSVIVTVPNGGPKFRIDTSRAALVTKQVNLIIQNGMLGGTDVTKPSQFLAGVSIPTQLLGQLLQIPSNILTFRVQQIEAQQSLSAAQTSLMNQLVAQIQAQQALTAAKQ